MSGAAAAAGSDGEEDLAPLDSISLSDSESQADDDALSVMSGFTEATGVTAMLGMGGGEAGQPTQTRRRRPCPPERSPGRRRCTRSPPSSSGGRVRQRRLTLAQGQCKRIKNKKYTIVFQSS